MGIFYFTLLSTYITGFLARISSEKKYKLLFCLWISITAIILFLVAGLRNNIGDTYMYMHSYNLLAENRDNFNVDKDYAFTLMSILLLYISSDPQILIFTVALITNILNVAILSKYISYFELQIYMYITSGYYLVTMNGIRQSLAAAFVFAGTKYIIEGKLKKYIILILIISTFHASALIMILIYPIVRLEAWSKSSFKFIILAIIGVLGYNILSDVLFKVLENTQYNVYSNFSEGGSSLIRTIVNSVPVVLAFIKRNEIKDKGKMSNIFINMSIINLIFVTLGMYNWIFNRFTIYFQLYNFILVPYIIKNCFKDKERVLVYFMFLICYFIFFYREHVIGLNIQYKSNYKLSDFLYGG